ncbi:PREDICTED: mitochondrial substrate carrier family protein P-like isoform X2 [Tarenaya hassleriana]|uniref:mitochondrial substrate carrier family protein P-like isoform X2 n=1 Tax=Tarenaya hassleriana TaxID=28532 RepID=UPI00053C568A|nr:PREDICTED: mitochondrial substrate carrier family protein P-like isoform X2 [Tarenaya hassleriana]
MNPSKTIGNIVGNNRDSDHNIKDSKCIPMYVNELFAGGATGAIAKTSVAPLERIKILLQTRTEGFHAIGVFPALQKIMKHEGFLGLYKGNGLNVIRVIPYSGFQYLTYETYRDWFIDTMPRLGSGPVVDLLSGSAAGGTAVLCTYPLDLARTKLAYQVDAYKQNPLYASRTTYSSTIQDVLKNAYRQGGVRGIYRGIGPTMVGILPYAGLKFYMYEELKRRVPKEHEYDIAVRLSCGALAGLFAQTCTYPLDVIRRQMQVEILHSGNLRYKNSMEGLVSIIREQGWRQLYAGLSINFLKHSDLRLMI